MEVGGLSDVMSWVLGFGRQAEVLKPEHLRKAILEELTKTSVNYITDTSKCTCMNPNDKVRHQILQYFYDRMYGQQSLAKGP